MKTYINRFAATVAGLIALLVILVLFPIIAPLYIFTGIDVTAKILSKF
jgi:hypothetical protein